VLVDLDGVNRVSIDSACAYGKSFFTATPPRSCYEHGLPASEIADLAWSQVELGCKCDAGMCAEPRIASRAPTCCGAMRLGRSADCVASFRPGLAVRH
jgi:hypothetical protein